MPYLIVGIYTIKIRCSFCYDISVLKQKVSSNSYFARLIFTLWAMILALILVE